MLFDLYKKRIGKELTLAEIQRANRNAVRFVRLLAEVETTRQRDSNSKTDCSAETCEKPVENG
jgi:hypothetical protein